MEETSQARVRFEGSQPILRVENMQASLRFYVGALGFENVSWGTDDFTSVSRDQAAIYLCRGDQGRGGAWVFRRPTTRGRSRCKSRTLTATCSAWAANPGKPPGDASASKPLARRHPFLRQSSVGGIAPPR
jgi:catechol 2,3-dioxygenase-like lactoylglutathione lyase family enzyme